MIHRMAPPCSAKPLDCGGLTHAAGRSTVLANAPTHCVTQGELQRPPGVKPPETKAAINRTHSRTLRAPIQRIVLINAKGIAAGLAAIVLGIVGSAAAKTAPETSPSGKWRVSVSSDTTDTNVVLNSLTVTLAKSKTEQPMTVDLPSNALLQLSKASPEYHFVWSAKEEWLGVIVTHKYGEEAFTIRLSGPPDKTLRASPCLLTFEGTRMPPTKDVALCEVGNLEFVDEKRLVAWVILRLAKTEEVVEKYLVQQELATGERKKLKWPPMPTIPQ